MTEFNKIFFQTGPASNNSGWGKLVNACTADGIPVFAASSDAMAMLFDLQVARQTSGVLHEGNYIPTKDAQGNRFDFDFSIYATEQLAHAAYLQNAKDRWNKAEAILPPELDKTIISISLENEQCPYVGWGSADDPNDPEWEKSMPFFTGWADSFGWQAYYSAVEAVSRGLRYFAFGFAGGNPELGYWEQNGVLEFLRYAAQHYGQIGVALHEYSFADTLNDGLGYKIGRFQFLHNTCDLYEITRPQIVIKEFGWRERDIPSDAILQIPEIADLYAAHQNIIGAAIWTTQNGWGDASQRATNLIPQIESFTLSYRYDGDVDIPVPPEDDKRLGDARIPFRRVYYRVNKEASLNDFLQTCRKAYETRSTVGFSPDDAGIGVGLSSKEVYEVGYEFDEETIENWYENEYGVGTVFHINYP